jgi:hypothetical protein
VHIIQENNSCRAEKKPNVRWKKVFEDLHTLHSTANFSSGQQEDDGMSETRDMLGDD